MSMIDALGPGTRLEGLTDEQNQAIVDALMLMMLAEGEATEGQVRVFSGLLSELPSFQQKTEDDRAEYARRSIEKLERLDGPVAVRAYVDALAEGLPGADLRAVVVAMAASIGCVEGRFSDAQLRLLEMMGDALGVDAETFGDVVAKLARGAEPDALRDLTRRDPRRRGTAR